MVKTNATAAQIAGWTESRDYAQRQADATAKLLALADQPGEPFELIRSRLEIVLANWRDAVTVANVVLAALAP
jgi:hypothetical protein